MLTLVMIASVFAVSSSAQVYVDADFSNMGTFTTHFHAGLYYPDDEGSIYGYKDALCLQTVGEWIEYDTTIDVMFEEDDMATGDRSYSVWYCNINPETYGVYDGGAYIQFGYDITNRQCYIVAPDLDTGETVDLIERVPMELEDGETYTFGMSVTNKRVRCFIDGKLIFDYVDEANTYLIGKQDELTESTAIVYWNTNNLVHISDVKISSPTYLFPLADEPADTEATTTEATTTSETTTKIVEEIVTNVDGETSVVTKVVTEATTTPKAETDNKPAGGSSNSTGDASFAVVAALVATLGCAVIIKKADAQ